MTSWKKSFWGGGPWPLISNSLPPSKDAILDAKNVAMTTKKQLKLSLHNDSWNGPIAFSLMLGNNKKLCGAY